MLRVSELAVLTTDDVRFTLEFIELRIKRSKTDQESAGATVKLEWKKGCDARKILEEWWKKNAGPFVLGSKDGAPLKVNSLSQIFKKTVQKYGISCLIHALRGGGATAALKKGMPRDVVMRLGRWKSGNAFECYVDSSCLDGVLC